MPVSDLNLGFVEALVETCRSRIAGQLRTREGFLGLAVCLVGFCSLLVLGTRYVPFVTLPLVAGLGAWIAIQRLRACLPTSYAVAQLVDTNSGLHDALSTAYHFRTAGLGWQSAEVAKAQYESASKLAATIDPKRAFPRAISRAQRSSVWLLASALVLFGLRVGLQANHSFEPPLASLILTAIFGEQPGSQASALPRAAEIDRLRTEQALPGDEEFFERSASQQDAPDSQLPSEDHEQPPDQDGEMPDVEGLITVPLEEQGPEGMPDDSMLQAEQSDLPSEGEGGEMPTDPGSDAWDEEAQSLFDKLKQAFDNMLQTLDMASAESSSSESGQEQGSGSTEEAASSGNPADSGEAEQDPSAQAADASMEGGEAGPEAGESASAGSTSGEDSTGDQSSGENASAAGTSDGDKELAEAEQLEVLGALEELYMERAEKMRGEVTIETRLAEQSASVPYNQRSTSHGDGGGAVSRDEIPAPYRTYIQNYFDTLRRNAE